MTTYSQTLIVFSSLALQFIYTDATNRIIAVIFLTLLYLRTKCRNNVERDDDNFTNYLHTNLLLKPTH